MRTGYSALSCRHRCRQVALGSGDKSGLSSVLALTFYDTSRFTDLEKFTPNFSSSSRFLIRVNLLHPSVILLPFVAYYYLIDVFS